MKDHLTVSEVAEILLIGEMQVRGMCRSGELPAFKVRPLNRSTWFVDVEDFRKYVQELKETYFEKYGVRMGETIERRINRKLDEIINREKN